MKRYLLTALSIGFSIILTATNYYASPSGNGNGKTYSTPCSISDGISSLASGDTLFLLGGTYGLSSKITVSKSGTSSKRTAIFAYPGEKPVLDFRTQAYGDRGISISSNTNYIHIKGLTICYAGKNGLINYGSYCQIENVEIYGCGDTGLQMKSGGNNYILNCDSHDNFDYKLGGTTAADFGGNADGFADKQYTGGANTYEGCRAWNNSDDGWDFFQHVSNSTPTIMKNCICYQNGPASYDMSNHARYNTDKTWFDQFINGKTVVDDDGNSVTISLEKYVNFGNGNGFKLGGGYTVHNVELQNCLAVNNSVRGFDQNNNFGTMTVYNASAYDNGVNYGFGNSSGGTLVIKNCLSLQTRSANYLKCLSVTDAYNSWNINGITCNAADFSSLDTTIILSARNADGSLANTIFMQLVEGSDLIDAGTNVGLPYSGNAPDLGCYEYGDFDNYPGAIVCTTANASQSLINGQAIANIVFLWSGGATGLTIDDLPAGLTQATDTTAKTLTLSGTPTFTGVKSYTISTVGGSGTATTLSGTITVKSSSAKQIAYVTTPDNSADTKILEQLNANMDFSVNIEDAATINDYSEYDLIVISSVPSSNAAGMASIEGIAKPLLLLKPFMLKSQVWNWGSSQNSADLDMKIMKPEHVIFTNITITDSLLRIFSSCTTNAVTYISSWTNSTTPTEIATPVSATGQSIAEMAAGSNMNGTTLTEKMLMIGVSEYSTAYLTNTGTKLIENACYYLLGMTIPSDMQEVTSSTYKIQQTAEKLEVSSNNINSLKIYSLAGQIIASANGNQISVNTLTKGIYILGIDGNDGIEFQKFIKH